MLHLSKHLRPNDGIGLEDLASLGGPRAEEGEEGLELKTPTQEDQAGLASCATSDGSSGYGSQGSGQMELDGQSLATTRPAGASRGAFGEL